MSQDIKDFLKPKHGKTKQGYYIAKNVNKYKGDPSKIIFRSSWEYKFATWLDINDNVIEWATEPFSIKYFYKADTKIHRYYPDFYFSMNVNGEIKKYIVEVKPSKDLRWPDKPKRITEKTERNYYYQISQYTKNYDKWETIKQWCKANGFTFYFLTEHSKLF